MANEVKLTKNKFIPFLDVLQGGEGAPSFKRIDKSTIFSLNPNPQTESQDYICYEAPVEEVDHYEPELPQEIALYEGNPMYDFMMLIDYLTGVIVAWRGKSPKSEGGGVSSRAGFDGLIRKFFIMVVVLVATLLDAAIGNSTRVFQTAATMYYIANEGISILENTSLMGVVYPEFVRNALETMRDKNDKADDDEPPDKDE